MPEVSSSATVETTEEEKPPEIPDKLGVLPVKGIVFFPYLTIPLVIGKTRSIKLIDDVLPGEHKTIAVVATRPEGEEVDEPGPEHLFRVGTAVKILRMAKVMPDRYQIIGQGVARVKIKEFSSTDPYIVAEVEPFPEGFVDDPETSALVINLKQQFRKFGEFKGMPEQLLSIIDAEENAIGLCYLIAAQAGLPIVQLQSLIESLDFKDAIKILVEHLIREVDNLTLASEIQGKIKDGMEKNQREYLLREQMRMIQKELGDDDPQQAQIRELEERLSKARLPEEAMKVARRELDRLSRIPAASAEYTVALTYLDWILDLPWEISTEEVVDIVKAERILDEDHFDLDKVKRRIIEYLAVRKLKKDMRGPILCFSGPPGVGKTSLGQSIARALNRKFIRMSLGGVRDEAEIRGHRRTYVGALPGRIIQGLRKVGSMNPVFMLDEIDKLGSDFRGDPSSALLEVLDPEQNFSFSDHYLEIQYDLSKVMFITTANVLHSIPPPLRDRMEVLELPGYTDYEKLSIAKKYLVKRQLDAHGLFKKDVSFSDGAIREIIRSYTREAGVRNLERNIGSVCRKIATDVAKGRKRRVKILPKSLQKMLGQVAFMPETEIRRWGPGLAIGLAWTPVGGELLFIETGAMPGHGGFKLTGQLGDVMKESAQAAFSYLRAHAREFGVPDEYFDKNDVHIHIPSGSIPKDGPSAGITLLTALASLVSGKPADRKVCMTGEVTLRGDVLPVGGVKEKMLAANRAGIYTALLPVQNEKDLSELPEEVRKEMDFILVERVEQVLKRAIPGLWQDRKAVSKTASRTGTKAHKRRSASGGKPAVKAGRKSATGRGA